MNATSETPEQLLNRAREGDTEALETLLIAVQPQLYRFSLKMCRQSQDAEDVLQDSMMTLARSFRDFRGASSLSTWLFTIARSFCIKKRRKSKFAPAKEESLHTLDPFERDTIADRGPSPAEQLETKETWEQVQWGIQQLEPSYREILVLRDIEGLATKEVAEIVGLGSNAVKSRLHRARSQLRDALTKTPYIRREGCPDIRLVFSQHLEGDLSQDICNTMKEHVDQCPICSAECAGLQVALNACSTSVCEVPAHVQEQVRAGIKLALSFLS
jgi:RNA polymerase sigma-70 factor, ECF subfamily